jgi:signal transduction histidine kinase
MMQHFLDLEDDREVYEAQVAGFRTQLAMARRNYNDAMSWSDVEIELCRRQDFNTFLNALKHRTEVLQTLGHYEEALRAYHSYDRQKDSIIKADSRQQLNELNKRFEVDELKAQHERTALEHERTLLQIYLFVALVVLVFLVSFMYFRHRAAHRLRRAHALLEERNQLLQQSYEQLKVANARAEESSKMKTNFIQQISHEIRTPLNILSGFTQIMTTPGLDLDDATKLDASRQITENTDRITGLVNKMIELSDANSSTIIDCTDDVLAVQIAAQAADDSGITAAPHVIFDMQMDAQSEALMLHTNLRSATRALTLLLDNARKFTRPAEAKGPVAVIKQEHVTLRLVTNTSELQFIVEDTGIGVPPNEAQHIFEEFVQLDEYYDGTGIGLTVARSLARRLGGDIRLDTTYSPGARFIMALPL